MVVELMGAPGAGKSTIAAAMRASGVPIVTPPTLTRRPSFAPHVLATAAALARRGVFGRGWNSTLLAMAAELRALRGQVRTSHILLFDQGPLYTLMRPPLRDPRLHDWWDAHLACWGELLDVVVYLDAPAEVLAERIDSREKEHRYKGRAAVESIQADRDDCEGLLARLRGPEVLRFDTSRTPAADIAAEVVGRAR